MSKNIIIKIFHNKFIKIWKSLLKSVRNFEFILKILNFNKQNVTILAYLKFKKTCCIIKCSININYRRET